MNDKEKELQFLQIVRVNGNIYHLVFSDWSYREIVEMLSYFSKKGMISTKERGTYLTPKGNEYYKQLYKSMGKKGVARFLTQATDHRIEQLSKESVYIPTKFRASEEF